MKWSWIILYLLLLACTKIEENKAPCFVYQDCRVDYEGRYCTNGKKFGSDNRYQGFGVDAPGPSSSGNIVTFSFQSPGAIYEATFHGSFESKSFSEIGTFAQDKVREALAEFESHIDITFEETADEGSSDLKIICADIDSKAGIGFSECSDNLCIEMQGFVFLKNNPISKENFYSLALHEIGHALGLCHSNSTNIMSYNSNAYAFDALQEGDIEGIKSIYGSK